MNQYDSTLITSLLIKDNHQIIQNESKADILIFNTCSVRKNAEQKVINKIKSLEYLKDKNPYIKIIIIGCMAQRLGNKLIDIIPCIDFIIGVNQILKIPSLINKSNDQNNENIFLKFNSNIQYKSTFINTNAKKISDDIAVMRGCNMFCSYCIVPYVRGKETSRPIKDIIDEIKQKVDNGTKEITLIGQNIAAYGIDFFDPILNKNIKKKSLLPELLIKVNNIEGIKRINFISPHPYFFDNYLINTISELPKINNNIHLVLQSGSNKILKKMNRKYNIKDYMKIIDNLKSKINNITLSTDIIVGFPGETEKDFNDTRIIFNEILFQQAYIFKYSPREGTVAFKTYKNNISDEIKNLRNQILLKDLKKNILKFNSQLVGKTFEVLTKKNNICKQKSNEIYGKTSNGKIIKIISNEIIQPGKFIKVTISSCVNNKLISNTIK